VILHLSNAALWAKAQTTGCVITPSLAEEGFIHCSTLEQVEATANRIFRGSGELVLLVVDPAALTAPLKWERATDVGEDFPHVYGPLNVEAVVRVVAMPEGPEGYVVPEALRL
jgi:uncharacterized protein (DUF952 family)